MNENQELSTDTSMDMDSEKMLPQSHVNKIVQREKEQTYLKAKREVEEQYQRQLEELQAKQTQRNDNVPRDVDANAIYQQVQERFNAEMQQKQLENEMSRVAQSYHSKMSLGKDSYDDFDEITKDFDPTAWPQLTYLVAGLDNAADVVYDLSKNPMKLAALDRIAEKDPRKAQAELLKLSRSITENRQATNNAESQNVSAPLDRLSPSRVSGSNGKMSIKDQRNQSWLRG